MIQDKGPKIEAMNKTQLAALYKICRRTFNNWLNKQGAAIGSPPGRIYTPAQVRHIFEIFGPPPD